jgi:molecular chaperone DnaK (HSP70)
LIKKKKVKNKIKKIEIEKKLEPIINKAQKRKDFSEYLKDLNTRINDNNDILSKLNENDKKNILKDLQDLNQWLLDNPNASIDEIDKKKKGKKKNKK